MSKKAAKIKIEPGSPEALISLMAAVGVIKQQLVAFNKTREPTDAALNDFYILELFSKDQKTLNPQQVELLTKAVGGYVEMVRELGITVDTLDTAVHLIKGEKES